MSFERYPRSISGGILILMIVFSFWFVLPVSAQKSPGKIAEQLDKKGKTVKQIVVAIQKEGYDSAATTAEAIYKVGRKNLIVLAQALKDTGHPAGESAIALKRLPPDPDPATVLHALRSARYDTDDVAMAAREIGNKDVDQLVSALLKAETLAEEVGKALRNLGEISLKELLDSLKEMEVSNEEIGKIIKTFMGPRQGELICEALKKAGYPPRKIANVLFETGYRSAESLLDAGRNAKYTLSEMFNIVFTIKKKVSPAKLSRACRRRGEDLGETARLLHEHGYDDLEDLYNLLEKGGFSITKRVQAIRKAKLGTARDCSRLMKEVSDMQVTGAVETLLEAGFSKDQVAKSFTKSLWSAREAARTLKREVYNGREEVAVRMFSLDYTGKETVKALRHADFHDPYHFAVAMKKSENYSNREITIRLVVEGYSSKEIRRALARATDLSADEILDLMESSKVVKQAKKRAETLARSMKVDGHSPEKVVKSVRNKGFLRTKDIAEVLIATGWKKAGDLIPAFAETGYSARQIFRAMTAIEAFSIRAIADWLRRTDHSAGEVARSLGEENINTVKEIYEILADAGFSPKRIGRGLRMVARISLKKVISGTKQLELDRDVLGRLIEGFGKYSPRGIAESMKEAGYPLEAMIEVLEAFGTMDKQKIISALADNNHATYDLIKALIGTGYRSEQQLAKWFRAAKASPRKIASALKKAVRIEGRRIAVALIDAGFSLEETLRGMRELDWNDAQSLANVVKQGPGYGSEKIAAALRQLGFDIHSVASALKQIDITLLRIGKALYEAGWKNFKTIVGAIRNLGESNNKILKKVIKFAGAQAMEVKDIFGSK